MKNSFVTLGFVCALTLGVAPAAAQSTTQAKPRPSLTAALTGAAKEAFVSAGVLLNNSDHAGALEKYQQAYDLSKDPRLLFNMAICARGLKAYARMQRLLVRYEHEAGSDMPAAERRQLDAALNAIQDLVGTIRLVVNEAGANVTLDGQPVGSTPLDQALVADLGSHTLHIDKTGFEPLERQLTVQGGTETPLEVMLKAVKHVAQLTVIADGDATVVVDSEIPAKGRIDAQLAPGVHEVQVTERGKITYRTQIELQDGETRTMQVTLEGEKHRAAIWPWIVGGAAVAAGAAVGGYFLFRPQETTTGAPTGPLGSLTLSSWRTR